MMEKPRLASDHGQRPQVLASLKKSRRKICFETALSFQSLKDPETLLTVLFCLQVLDF